MRITVSRGLVERAVREWVARMLPSDLEIEHVSGIYGEANVDLKDFVPPTPKPWVDDTNPYAAMNEVLAPAHAKLPEIEDES